MIAEIANNVPIQAEEIKGGSSLKNYKEKAEELRKTIGCYNIHIKDECNISNLLYNFNILLIGPVVSGKSSLIKSIYKSLYDSEEFQEQCLYKEIM